MLKGLFGKRKHLPDLKRSDAKYAPDALSSQVSFDLSRTNFIHSYSLVSQRHNSPFILTVVLSTPDQRAKFSTEIQVLYFKSFERGKQTTSLLS